MQVIFPIFKNVYLLRFEVYMKWKSILCLDVKTGKGIWLLASSFARITSKSMATVKTWTVESGVYDH
jgi:hypothetical protein